MGSGLLEVVCAGGYISLRNGHPIFLYPSFQRDGVASTGLTHRHGIDGRRAVLADQAALVRKEAHGATDIAGVKEH